MKVIEVRGWIETKGYKDTLGYECLALGDDIIGEVFKGKFHKTYTGRIKAWWLKGDERTRFKDKASAKA